MKIVQVGKKYISVPAAWNELSRRQLPQVMQLFNTALVSDERQLQLFKVLTELSYFRLWLIGAEILDDLLYLTDFMFGKNLLTNNVIPNYRGRYGPANNFDNLIISEFVFTEMYYMNYKFSELTAKEKLKDLNRLIAVLYRAGKALYNIKLNNDGDIRQSFNDNLIPHGAIQVSRWPMKIKHSILHWYEGCRASIVEDFPEVFSGSDNGSDQTKYGLWDLIYNIADKGIFGEFAKVETQFLKTILMAVTKIMAEAESLKNKPVKMADLLFIPFQNYLKGLCEIHVDVRHVDGTNNSFVRYQSEDDVLQIPQHAGSMIVVVSNFVGRAIGAPDDSMMRQNATLLFLKRTVAGTGDPAQEVEDAQGQALNVMFDFYVRMTRDKEMDECGPLRHLQYELMTWQPVDGPILENHYGWEMNIPFDASFPAYNSLKWIN